MEKEIISSRQFTIVTFLYSIGTAILIIPSSITGAAKQDAWIAASIGVLLSLLLVKLFLTLANQTPSLNFIEANEKILGRFWENHSDLFPDYDLSFCWRITLFYRYFHENGSYARDTDISICPTVQYHYYVCRLFRD